MLAAICRKYLEISKVQIKLTLLDNLAVSILLVAISPLIFGIKNLTGIASSFVLERFISLCGIILLTPIFLPEQDKDIAELVESKFTSPISIYLTRLILSMILLVVIISGFIFVMFLQSCEFNITMFIAGTFATAFFLGSIGFIAYGISNNIVAGYLLSLGYYMLNMSSRSDSFKNMYLFSLSRNSFNEKYWLFAIGSLFIIATLFYKYFLMKRR